MSSRVVEVIAPLRIQAEAPGLGRTHQARIVQIAFGDHDEMLSHLELKGSHFACELLQKMNCGAVDKGVDRIEA